MPLGPTICRDRFTVRRITENERWLIEATDHATGKSETWGYGVDGVAAWAAAREWCGEQTKARAA